MRQWNQASSFPIYLCEAGRATLSDFVPALSPRRACEERIYAMYIDIDPRPGILLFLDEEGRF